MGAPPKKGKKEPTNKTTLFKANYKVIGSFLPGFKVLLKGAFGGPSVPVPLKGTQGNGSVDTSVAPNKEANQNRISDALEPWNLAPALTAAPCIPNKTGMVIPWFFVSCIQTSLASKLSKPGPNQLKNSIKQRQPTKHGLLMAVIPGLILTRTPVVAQNGLECIENPWKGQTLGHLHSA